MLKSFDGVVQILHFVLRYRKWNTLWI